MFEPLGREVITAAWLKVNKWLVAGFRLFISPGMLGCHLRHIALGPSTKVVNHLWWTLNSLGLLGSGGAVHRFGPTDYGSSSSGISLLCCQLLLLPLVLLLLLWSLVLTLHPRFVLSYVKCNKSQLQGKT